MAGQNDIIEEWRSIVGYEGFYEASNLGRIRSCIDRKNTFSGRILKPAVRNGYYYVSLNNGEKRRLLENSKYHILILPQLYVAIHGDI